MRSPCRSFANALRRLGRSRDGAAAVEFVLIAPLLIALYFGATELTLGFGAHQKVQAGASAVSDLISRQKEFTPAEVDGLMRIAETIMYPYDAERLVTRITIVEERGSNPRRVIWWRATNGGAAPTAEELAVVPRFSESQDDVGILVETFYNYEPFGVVLDAPLQLKGLAVWKGRRSRVPECPLC